MPGDNVQMTIELITPIAMDEGLRFAIREGGRTVGAGVVTKILKYERSQDTTRQMPDEIKSFWHAPSVRTATSSPIRTSGSTRSGSSGGSTAPAATRTSA